MQVFADLHVEARNPERMLSDLLNLATVVAANRQRGAATLVGVLERSNHVLRVSAPGDYNHQVTVIRHILQLFAIDVVVRHVVTVVGHETRVVGQTVTSKGLARRQVGHLIPVIDVMRRGECTPAISADSGAATS